MKTISDKTYTFEEIYRALAEMLDGDGVLRDVTVSGIQVHGIPINFQVFEEATKRKLYGITLATLDARFFGFKCENVVVRDNVFFFKKCAGQLEPTLP